MRTGIANLPLHFGTCPPWLFEKMTRLSRQILLVIASEFGISTFLARLSDPFWFQALSCVLGFDWHSSGTTTTVCGALKEGIRGLENDFGLYIAGGKGKTSRKTPQEIINFGEKLGKDFTSLVSASRLAAKVDNTAVQDGYQLYHHVFFFTAKGQWVVIQQGMKPSTSSGRAGWARRYHWLSNYVFDFVCEPHTGIACDYRGETLNLVAKESQICQKATAKIAQEKPEKLLRFLDKLQKLNLPSRHALFLKDLKKGSLKKIFLKTYQTQAKDFENLLGISGVGPKTIRALSLIAELVYGAKPSWEDPAKFSFAHGGKDGYPYPVDKAAYEKSINILQIAVEKAKIGDREKLNAVRKLNALV